MRVLSVLDLCTRECLLPAADRTFRGEQVARVLGELGEERRLPARITVDNGTDFTSKALATWRTDYDHHRPHSGNTSDLSRRHR